jgi:hypothetical protein
MRHCISRKTSLLVYAFPALHLPAMRECSRDRRRLLVPAAPVRFRNAMETETVTRRNTVLIGAHRHRGSPVCVRASGRSRPLSLRARCVSLSRALNLYISHDCTGWGSPNPRDMLTVANRGGCVKLDHLFFKCWHGSKSCVRSMVSHNAWLTPRQHFAEKLDTCAR